MYINIGGAILGLVAGYMFNVISIRNGLMIAFVYTLFVLVIMHVYKRVNLTTHN